MLILGISLKKEAQNLWMGIGLRSLFQTELSLIQMAGHFWYSTIGGVQIQHVCPTTCVTHHPSFEYLRIIFRIIRCRWAYLENHTNA